MSYARKGLDGSEVYVYTDGDRWVCHGCPLLPVDGGIFVPTHEEPSPGAMLEHLLLHRKSNHAVPESALQRLKREHLEGYPLPEEDDAEDVSRRLDAIEARIARLEAICARRGL